VSYYKIGDNLYGNDAGQYWSNKQLSGGGTKRMYQSSPYDMATSRINNMYAAQQKQQVGALAQQQSDAMRGYNQQKKQNAVTYQGQRNAADVTNAQNVQSMREAMAANGIQASGENVTAQAGLAAQRQSALGGITTQQNQANKDAYSQIADIMNPRQKQNILNTISAQKSQALSDAFNNYLSRLDQQHGNYMNQLQNDRSYNEGKREFDLGQSQNQNQYNSNQAYQYWLAKQNLAQGSGANGAGFQNSGGGGGTTQGTAAFNVNLAAANKRGLSSSENADLTWLVSHESSFNPNAKNPKSSAHGYAQFLNSTEKEYSKKTGLNYSNPVDQLLMMEQYIKDRYGSAAKAKQFWLKNNYY
jgi:hypothetical protein